MAFVSVASHLVLTPVIPPVQPRRLRRQRHSKRIRCSRARLFPRASSEGAVDNSDPQSNGVPLQASLADSFSGPTNRRPKSSSLDDAGIGSIDIGSRKDKDSSNEFNQPGMAADVEEMETCVGDILWSPSLQEYREQREAGLTSPAADEKKEKWGDIWMLAVNNRKAKELHNQYSRVGIFIDRNFQDFQPTEGCSDAFQNASLEELSLSKARQVYEATGLPAIAETSDFAIDPPQSGSGINKTLQQGYYTRQIEEIEGMVERVRPISNENRMTHFQSCVAYYDGEIEMTKQGTAHVAILFSGVQHVAVATTAALDELYKEHTRRFKLELDGSVGREGGDDRGEEGEQGKVLVGASMLKERILRDGKMLDEGIIKVSSFLNHMVDTELMEVCGQELAERLRHTMPSKLLTVESTGLIAGLPTARMLGIPLVFARKSRPITISDSYQTTYRSATKGVTSELIVSCEYLEAGDRVLIIDDFLAGGSTAEALFKLARMAHAKVVGVGVLIEKMSDGGRAFLSGYDVPVESLAKILPGGDKGGIEFVEEEPWVSPMVKKSKEKKLKEEALKANAEYFERTRATAGGVSAGESGGEAGDDSKREDDEVDVLRWDEDEDEDGTRRKEELLDEIEDGLIKEVGKL
eukprot:GFKZ01006850.1.p1 GENE.GFKZ01006850.1~~GFKZ01006850.1.p1  ORF type:complete len:637 (-),score=115.82 GFKZ01006850.1:77-1987(-)